MRTTIISVSYNSASVIGAMIAGVPKNVRLIIVDNASTDDSVRVAEQTGAEVIKLVDNQGFGRACNAGAQAADSEFLLFLNPDAVLQQGCLAALENAADTYQSASAFNPRICDPTGGQFFKRSSRLLPRKNLLKRGWPETDTEVPILSGSALFCRRKAFEAVNGFDPEIFLYHEDDDLSLRLKAACGPLMFVHSATIMHVGGSSSPRSPEIAKIKSYHLARSRVYAMRKHGRPFAFSRSLWSGFTKLISPVVLFSARKRAQALAFMQGVWSMRT
jgi:N-acetylglucosaminyl-diphospho-decaprenol L-rhamnosyltransferase